MSDVNTIMLLGRVGKDPELRKTATGKSVANFSLCTNRSVRTAAGEWDEVPEWHRIVAWDKQAERAERQVNKGDKVFVEGHVRYSKWTDNNGSKRTSTEVVVKKLELMGKKRTNLTAVPSASESSGVDAVPF